MVIRENFQIQTYEEATSGTAPRKHIVTLIKADDEKAMITLFLLERAWTLSSVTPENGLKIYEKQKRLKMLSRAAVRQIGTRCARERCKHKLKMRRL